MNRKPEVELTLCQQDCLHRIGDSPSLEVSMAFLKFLAGLVEIARESTTGSWARELGDGFVLSLKGDRLNLGARVTITAPGDQPNLKFELPTCFGTMLESAGAPVGDGISVRIQGGCAYALSELRTGLERHYPRLTAALDKGEILLNTL